MTNLNEKGVILHIVFYNIKALGVRYLESALEQDGYRVVTVFHKGFNSIRPKKTTKTELNLLCNPVRPILEKTFSTDLRRKKTSSMPQRLSRNRACFG